MTTRIAAILLIVVAHAGPFFSGTGHAFSQFIGPGYELSLTGSVAAGAGLASFPNDSLLSGGEDQWLWNGDLRLIGEGGVGEDVRFKANVLQNYRSTPVLLFGPGRAGRYDVERSSLLYWQQHDSSATQAAMVLDVAQMAWGKSVHELTVGRQPIGLSVTFYFTPNDFFAPFAPQNFYRAYKPGVDAVRYERRVGALSQVTLLSVLGYAADPGSDSGWGKAPDWQRTSLLGRWVLNTGLSEWGLLGGIVREAGMFGISFQGELFGWLGVRAEGHYMGSGAGDQRSGTRVSLGLDHRFPNSLNLRFEQLHNGTGYASMEEVNKALQGGTLHPGYLGRNYSAFGLAYEFTPLLRGEFLLLHNWTDSSQSVSLYSVFSLSDESEIALNFSLPFGKEPDAGLLNSEAGLQPVRCTLEYRLYF